MSEIKPIGISMDTELLNAIDSSMKKAGAVSRSEFVCDAVSYYLAALNAQEISSVLSPAVEATIRATVQDSENHIKRMMFKTAVELDMMMHVVAATNEIDLSTLSKLRGMCVNEVKSSIGSVNFDNAAITQKG